MPSIVLKEELVLVFPIVQQGSFSDGHLHRPAVSLVPNVRANDSLSYAVMFG